MSLQAMRAFKALRPFRGGLKPLAAQVTALFASGEKGVWYDPSDLDAGKIAWRRNLLTYSEQFDNAAWTKTRATVVGDKLIEDTTATNNHLLRYATNLFVSGNTYTFVIEVKAVERTKGSLYLYGLAATECPFDLVAKTIGKGSAALSSSITELEDGWFRISETVSYTGTGTSFAIQLCDAAGQGLYTGDGASGMRVRRAQLEVGSTPTAYQRFTDFSSEFLAAFPNHTLFQDAAGTTPVAKAGEPVGLVLDKSKGLVRGPELEPRPDTSAIWVGEGTTPPEVNGNTNYLGRACRSATFGVVSGGSFAAGRGNDTPRPISVVAGKCYEAVYELATSRPLTGAEALIVYYTGAAGMCSVSLTSANTGGTWQRYSSRTYAAVTGTNGLVTYAVTTTSPVTVYLRAVSVRELPGNHATQSTSTARPILRQTPVLSATERVSNGAFDANITGWTVSGGGWVWSGGKAALTGDGTVQTLRQDNVFEIGKTYQVTFDVTATSSTIGFENNANAVVASAAAGTVSVVWTADRTSLSFKRVGGTVNGTLDNISVREVTSYRTDQNFLEFDGVDDFLVTQSIDFGTVSIPDTQMGPELVTNGAFVADLAGWTDTDTGTGASQWNAAGYMELTGIDVSNRGKRSASIATVVGKTYLVTFRKVAGAGVSTQFTVGGASVPLDVFPLSALGTYQYSFVAGAATHSISFNAYSAGTVGIDDVSIREIPAERAADKMTVVAGVRKMASDGMIVESSVTAGANNGTFYLYGGGSAAYVCRSRGTAAADATTPGNYASPNTAVLCGACNIAGDVSNLRVNGAQAANSATDQGTGNFGNYPLYIGRRGGTSLPFAGRLHGLIIRGAASSDSQIKAAEKYLAGKTGVTLQ